MLLYINSALLPQNTHTLGEGRRKDGHASKQERNRKGFGYGTVYVAAQNLHVQGITDREFAAM